MMPWNRIGPDRQLPGRKGGIRTHVMVEPQTRFQVCLFNPIEINILAIFSCRKLSLFRPLLPYYFLAPNTQIVARALHAELRVRVR